MPGFHPSDDLATHTVCLGFRYMDTGIISTYNVIIQGMLLYKRSIDCHE